MTHERHGSGSEKGDSPVFVLIHSPLVGTSTWDAVVAELRIRGISTCVPVVRAVDEMGRPFWEQHVDAIEQELSQIADDRQLVLVGHSGAGALLPATGRATRHHVAAYLFVDAGIPKDRESRLSRGPFADDIHQLYAAGGRYPSWTDEDLRELVPDDGQRQRLLAELCPPPLEFWDEAIPVFPGWPDAPCGYLRFVPNPAYDDAASEAKRRGWAYAELAGGHFHQLVDPAAVVTTLVDLASQR